MFYNKNQYHFLLHKLKGVIFMSIFNKNNKKKIALALACASIFGGKSSLAAQNTGKVGGAIVSSNKMGTLTKSLIIGGSILGGAGLIYEILGDTVIDKAPTILKLIRGKSSDKTEKQSVEDPDEEYMKNYYKEKEKHEEEMANKKKYKTIPYWGHRYFRYKPEKNKDKIGLTEEQQKIEKIFDYVKGVSVDIFNYDDKDEDKDKDNIKNEFVKKYPNLNFDEVKQSRKDISNAINNRDITDEDLEKICQKVLSWVPNEYFDGIEMKKFKFYADIVGYVLMRPIFGGSLSYKGMLVRLF